MKYKKVTCPHCDGKLKINEGDKKFICPYCEKTLVLDSDGTVEVLGEDLVNEKKAVEKKRAKKKKSMMTLMITLGAILLVLAVAYIFRHQIINLFTKPNIDPHAGDDPHGQNTSTESTVDTVIDDSERDDVYNFLICGQDKVSGLTDVNLLISFNTSKLTMSVMQIPRDTNMSHDGYDYPRANGVYGYFLRGNNSDSEYIQSKLDKYDYEKDAELRAIAGFAAMLEENLRVKIHYYGVMDLSGFCNIVDALGGVEMYVPYTLDYDDPYQDLHIHIQEGRQLLDGKMAEGVVRYREGFAMADIGRGNVQKMFMASLVKTIQDKANIFNLDKITAVCGIIADNLVTNMTTSDMIYFANNAMTLNMEYVTFMTAPVGGYQDESGTWYTCINKESTLNLINTYFNIYDHAVTSEEFDINNVFYMDSYYYYGPADCVPLYINKGSEMMDDDFKPIVGY